MAIGTIGSAIPASWPLSGFRKARLDHIRRDTFVHCQAARSSCQVSLATCMNDGLSFGAVDLPLSTRAAAGGRCWMGIAEDSRGEAPEDPSEERRVAPSVSALRDRQKNKCRDLQRDGCPSVSVGWDAMGWHFCHGSIVRPIRPSMTCAAVYGGETPRTGGFM